MTVKPRKSVSKAPVEAPLPASTAAVTTATARAHAPHFNRVMNVEDFDDPVLHAAVQAVLPNTDYRNRKAWELGMFHLALEHFGLLDGADRRFLGVGAGFEATIYHLTNYGEVHATDMYAYPGIWDGYAPLGMMHAPQAYAPAGLDWQPGRLIVQSMDMTALRYPDAHFDAVFSAGSIEHVGGVSNDFGLIERAAREIGRVLKPGGLALLTTEWKLSGEGNGWHHVVTFDETTLMRHVVEPSGLTLVDALWTEVTDASLATCCALTDIIAGKTTPPEVVIANEGYTFTAVNVCLLKG